jgi:hypothetical protein
MTALGLDVQRMAGFCNDGAATMAGVKSGVAARLKVVNLRIVIVRCVAHRTALVMSDTAKSSSELQAEDSELWQVQNLFNHNNKRQSQWEAFAKGYGITQLRFPIFNATRWFSRLQCVVVLTNNLAELIIFLGCATRKRNSKQPWPAGAAALKELRDVQVATKLNLLRNIMLPLDVLSKKFQHTSYLLPHHVRKATQQVVVELQTDFIEAELLSGQHYDNFKVSKRHIRVRLVS